MQLDNRYVAAIGPFPEGTTDADFGADEYHLVEVGDDQLAIVENNEFTYVNDPPDQGHPDDDLTLRGGSNPS
jgi:hypothetical protein